MLSSAALKQLEQAGRFGSRLLPNGTRLLGHVPHIGPEAWLHAIYGPLSDSQMLLVEKRLGRPIPTTIQEFWQTANGLCIFSCSLSIYGYRASYERTGDGAWQPFCVETPNTIERPPSFHESLLIVGSYRADGSHLVVDSRDNSIHRMKRGAKKLASWDSLTAMLDAEISRMAPFYDESGKSSLGRSSVPPP